MSVVNAVQLQHESERWAIEVHDESTDNMLPAEFQSEDASSSQQGPRDSLIRCRPLPELTSDCEFDGVRVAQTIESTPDHPDKLST